LILAGLTTDLGNPLGESIGLLMASRNLVSVPSALTYQTADKIRGPAKRDHHAKTGVNCPDLDESCRRASDFRYAAHQSEVTMGQYKSDYEITWRGKVVKLREHVGFGTSRDPRHTIRVAFFFDDRTKRVVVGYVGLHQQNRAT
jgi:hypothetical protein